MPQYQKALDFLQIILDLQAAQDKKAADLQLPIAPGVARKKWQTGRPLLTGEPLIISSSLFREILEELCLFLPFGETVRMTLVRLLTSNFIAPSNMDTLFKDYITDSKTCIGQIADDTATDPTSVAFILHTALSPFFKIYTTFYRKVFETAAWRRGICPICGFEPWMARLTHENGRRMLACSLCHMEWGFHRLCCPFCKDDGQQPKLRYFTAGGDDAHRIDCCERCRRYIKTIDERVVDRTINLQVEDVITAHLDGLAEEQGYR